MADVQNEIECEATIVYGELHPQLSIETKPICRQISVCL